MRPAAIRLVRVGLPGNGAAMTDDRKIDRHLLLISPDAFSPDEVRVAKLLAVGCRPGAIAEAMEITGEAVEAHRRSIFGRLGTSDEATLIRWAKRHDIGRW